MILILCVDDRNGLSYHKRRQTRDRLVIEDILKYADDKKLYLQPHTMGLVLMQHPNAEAYPIDELNMAEQNAVLFAETGTPEELETWIKNADDIILYNWHNTYLATEYAPDIMSLPEWSLTSITTFCGYSHPEIDRMLFERKIP